MKNNFIECANFGDARELKLASGEMPTAQSGQVLIKVAFAGVNRPDILQRKGLYPAPIGASSILGLEVSGEIMENNSNLPFKIGDKICALLPGGGYSEYAVCDAELCVVIPQNIDLSFAAALPETFYTVWANLCFDRNQSLKDKKILIHGGTSGIGTMAIQVAKFLGAQVATTARNAEKCQACVNLGADLALNYTEDNVEKIIKEKWGGIDFSLNMVGGESINADIALLQNQGVLVMISFLTGSKIQCDFGQIMRKRLTITGSTLRPRSTLEKAAIIRQAWQNCQGAIESGLIKPIIHKIFPLEQACQAHELMESSNHIGKILLKVN